MNSADILRMAIDERRPVFSRQKEISAFVGLVEQVVVEIEREACAKAMDDLAEDYKAASRRDDKRNLSLEADKWNQRSIAFRDAAAAIRARSKT